MSEKQSQNAAEATVENTRPRRTYQPDIDVVERETEFILTADMPGAVSDRVEVNYDDGKLSIHAPVESRLPEGAQSLLMEYGVSDYHREFSVNHTIDATKISADYHDGVLSLTLPKIEAVKTRRIEVSGG